MGLEDEGIAVRAVLQLMAVGHTGLEPGAIAGSQCLLARVAHEHDLPLHDEDELVLCRMPVPLARP
jgi:hypothetical protein